jgi:hypothetical protein
MRATAPNYADTNERLTGTTGSFVPHSTAAADSHGHRSPPKHDAREQQAVPGRTSDLAHAKMASV